MQGRDKYVRAATWGLVAAAAVALTGTAYAKKHHHAGAPGDTVSVVQVINLPNGQHIHSFDIGWVDAQLGLYFLADRTNAVVDVVDTATNQVINQLSVPNAPFAGAQASPDTSGPDGVLTVGDQVWAGDGNSTIKTFDEFTGGPIAILNTGGKARADEGCYDPKDKLVMMANDADAPPFVTIWDASKFPPVLKSTIVMSGATGAGPNATNGIEQCDYVGATGNFYVNIPEVNGPGNDTAPGAVVEISPTGAIVKVISLPLSGCAGPQGMADDGGTTIMLGCFASFSTVAIDANTGGVIATINDEGGADEIYYNSGDDTFYFGISSPVYSSLQRLGIVDNKTFQADVSVVTGIKSGWAGVTHGTNHSVAADSGTNQIYVPIADTAGGGICGAHGGVEANGCIAVLRAP
jgi:hypothetical protein